ncbi:nitronate monooxygenase [Frankia sp. AgB1.8]|uniref:nitronate monooxygenase n=1 Tax=Frankia sp. AgB1.8 TaxID=2792839 RepID=UPI0027DB241D|nr:nitronate monooxygenase [Frankia sp. AgB1.8]
MSPLGGPDPQLVAALGEAGALGVLDLGVDPVVAARALRLAQRLAGSPFGVRISSPDAVDPDELSRHRAHIDTVLIPGGVLGDPTACRLLDAVPDALVLAEVTSVREARVAVAVGVDGLLARGCEAGGRVGEFSSFVLLQQLLDAREALSVGGAVVPVWCWGGIGVHTAVAAVTGGAVGVVLDTQLGLLNEATTTEATGATLRRIDGSETVVAAGYRVYQAPAARRARGDVEAWSAQAVIAGLGAEDPQRQLLAVGQDAFLAAEFAARFKTTGRAVQAIRVALDAPADPTAVAAAHALLAEGSALCASWATTRPVAQRPMTRVSDQAGFARSVADDGALPFLALALADEGHSRQLLTETRDLLGARPWGVGLVGLAPEDLRTAQLAVVREIRPSCVIIAGGRPSQAAELEQVGISTFLHAPSPTLLRQFLDAGARRFVFEGSEGGSHVGPRASFPLWQAQLDVLLDYLDKNAPGGCPPALAVPGNAGLGLQALFAGGVHDARSAAMVAAMAGPLAARGVGVGLLMGTAYLFTQEAVEYGADQESLRRQVLTEAPAAVPQTAPGGLTSCAASPLVDRFQAARDDLRVPGLPDR